MDIRPATIEDTNEIFWLLMEMAEENTDREVSVAGTVDEIRRVTGLGGCIVAVNNNEKIVGSAGISPQSPWFTTDVFLGDSWFYVHPDHRISSAAAKMKKHLQQFAEHAGKDLVLAVHSTDNAERKNQFFARDMKLMGSSFVYEVEEK
jgi:hypothetical protein|tara:strand:- start:5840 stop:6283 length:444 start_codon:yes stop_codon:yes gene_type:complete